MRHCRKYVTWFMNVFLRISKAEHNEGKYIPDFKLSRYHEISLSEKKGSGWVHQSFISTVLCGDGSRLELSHFPHCVYRIFLSSGFVSQIGTNCIIAHCSAKLKCNKKSPPFEYTVEEELITHRTFLNKIITRSC